MAATVPRTKLAAVNAMLEDVGDRPVNSLAGSSRRDVTRAISTLDDFSRMVQSRGWWFNTERRRITVDGSGYYNIPDDIVHVEVEAGGPTTGQYDATPLLVIREGRLYDTANATDVFTGEPYIDVIVFKLLEFEKLPTNAREYIYAGASVRNQSRALGSRAVDADLQTQASLALAQLNEENIDAQNLDQTASTHFFTMMWDR